MAERVCDKIGEDYKSWTSEKTIVIHAPTGSGKTYFVLNVLLPYIHSQGKNMVYFCNRTALQQQVEHKLLTEPSLAEFSNSIITCSYQRLAALNLGPHDIMPSDLSPSEQKRWKEDSLIPHADYYIFDEAHFFLSDSSFNLQINDCLIKIKNIWNRNKNSIWIYMTATLPYLLLYLKSILSFTSPALADYMCNAFPDQVTPFQRNYYTYSDIPYLLNPVSPPHKNGCGYEWSCFFNSVKRLLEYKEMPDFACWQYTHYKESCTTMYARLSLQYNYNNDHSYFYNRYHHFLDRFTELKKQLLYYQVEADNSHIIPVYFTEDDELLHAVKLSAPEEKWLIFVESQKCGNSLKEKLHTAGYPDTVFITSKTKNEDRDSPARAVYTSIVKHERFSCKVLITTKVLDNGINLCDPALKHIVVQSFEETSFLQMLGRKRITDPAEKVKVYIRHLPEGTVRKNFQMRIQNIVLFWYQLYTIQNREKVLNPIIYSLEGFKSRYMEGGHYKAPYRNYICKRDIKWLTENERISKQNQALMVDLYAPPPYTKAKVVYDYYKMLAMFETAQNQRIEQLFLDERALQDEKAFESREHELMDQQFMWLLEQLSWMGFNLDSVQGQSTNPLHPANEQHWINVQNGRFPEAKANLLNFLHTHQGILTETEEDELKQLYRTFISLDRPPRKDTKSKGSVKKIQETFRLWKFPYALISKKMTCQGKQRNWWVITSLPSEA